MGVPPSSSSPATFPKRQTQRTPWETRNLGDEPEEDPVASARSDPRALRQLVDTLSPTIDKAIYQWGGGSQSPVLRQRARLLAANAVKSFDPSRGAKLETHVMQQLQTLGREANTIAQPLPIPERFRRDQAAVRRAQSDLEDTLGREPTDEEIAELTGLSIRRLGKIRRLMLARVPWSSVEDKEDDESADNDVVAAENDPYSVWTDAVYHDLGEVDRVILQHRSGYRGHEVLSNADIARRLNMTPAAVSQRAARIQQRLDEFHG